MERLNVRVDGRTKRALEAEARARGVSPSDVVREALTAHLSRRAEGESCLDLAERIGLLGCARGLPPDLSSDPRHMNGFGSG